MVYCRRRGGIRWYRRGGGIRWYRRRGVIRWAIGEEEASDGLQEKRSH